MSNKTDFHNYLAQTSPSPMGLEIVSAKGIFLKDTKGKKYLDLISGIAVSNLGHSHPKIIKVIKEQADKHTHLMVYGEYIQSAQVKFAKKIVEVIHGKSSILNEFHSQFTIHNSQLNSVYFVNSGSEAVEGALKLAKIATGRTEIITFRNAYHGSTHGALSVMGDEVLKQPFRPLLPVVKILPSLITHHLSLITNKTACVIIEPIQGEGGTIVPEKSFLQALEKQCKKTGALLILDEVQTGFGRTGALFAFEYFQIKPDILVIGKAMGGGLPLGAFISNRNIMKYLSENPPLGHITTFGGHPLSCAAGLAALKILLKEKLPEKALKKEKLFRSLLKHSAIKEIRGMGLMLAVQFESEELCKKIIDRCIKNGIIADWFLFCPSAMRIAPPLIINDKEIKRACKIILSSIHEVVKKGKSQRKK